MSNHRKSYGGSTVRSLVLHSTEEARTKDATPDNRNRTNKYNQAGGGEKLPAAGVGINGDLDSLCNAISRAIGDGCFVYEA
nr:hypothetical protein Iba_chr09fCG11440 [Ipomoea batatas]